jgi:hypothetical protein
VSGLEPKTLVPGKKKNKKQNRQPVQILFNYSLLLFFLIDTGD